MLVPSVSIQNKNGAAMLIDEEDLSFLTRHKDGYWCFSVNSQGFIILVDKKSLGGNGRAVPFHRLITTALSGLEVYHVNKNRLDNRKVNLQQCTHNRHRLSTVGYGTSKFKGVFKNGKSWRATFSRDYVVTHLGTFATELEAAKAYDAAVKLQGYDFHFLNFPDESPNV